MGRRKKIDPTPELGVPAQGNGEAAAVVAPKRKGPHYYVMGVVRTTRTTELLRDCETIHAARRHLEHAADLYMRHYDDMHIVRGRRLSAEEVIDQL